MRDRSVCRTGGRLVRRRVSDRQDGRLRVERDSVKGNSEIIDDIVVNERLKTNKTLMND